MKKVAIVLNSSWNIFNFRLNLLRSFKDNGYEVVIVAPYDEYTLGLKQEFKCYDVNISSKGTNPFHDAKTQYALYKIYKKAKPDVILHYTIKPNIYGTVAASVLNIPTINNIAGLGNLFVKQNFLTKLAKRMYKYSQKKASKVFFQNKDDYGLFITERLVDKNKCSIIPGSGVDLERFKCEEYKKENNKITFLLMARIFWNKGIGEYVEAAKLIQKKYKNVEFQLLGAMGVDNPSAIPKSQIDAWTKEGLINYLGRTDKVENYIKKADCIVLPSFYREGVPRVLLESGSMSKPLITTNHIGCKEAVDDKVSGFLCKIKDSDDLADKMEKMLNLSEDERLAMGKKGREKMIKHFDEKIVINKYLDTIKELI